MTFYDMPLYRPPSEGPNLILQATLGCSFNGCTFCSMYKTKTFRARPLDTLFAEIDDAAADWPDAHRVFLADGDALVLPTDHLLALLGRLRDRLPELQRVSCYATPTNLLRKSVDELARLKAAGLRLVYVGIESGDPAMLRKIRKGATQASMIRALERARDAGLKVSATVILGLGGATLWRQHIAGTAELVNRAPPTYLSTLQLRLDPDLEARFMAAFGEPFRWQDDAGVLEELEDLVARLDPPRPVIFRSNHASNALALAGNLPKDRDRLLAEIGAARAGARVLRPRFLRGL
ncbi:MAG: radical SAM protein [Rhodobacterales bacterium]|nr:radical SAM protein [Rhodobacterales bacterium]